MNENLSIANPVQSERPEQQAAFDPRVMLDKQIGEQDALLESQFSQQRDLLNQMWDKTMKGMEEEYLVERRYLEETPMDSEAFDTHMRSLNKQYELKIVRARQQAEPHYLELQGKLQASRGQLMAQKKEADDRLNWIDELSAKGVIQNKTAAVQASLSTIGINLPLQALRPETKPPTHKQVVANIGSQLTAVRNEMRKFMLRKGSGSLLDSRGNVRANVVYSMNRDKKESRKLTDDEKTELKALFKLNSELETLMRSTLEQSGLSSMQKSMLSAAATQATPLAEGILGLIPDSPVSAGDTKRTNDPLGLNL